MGDVSDLSISGMIVPSERCSRTRQSPSGDGRDQGNSRQGVVHRDVALQVRPVCDRGNQLSRILYDSVRGRIVPDRLESLSAARLTK